MHSLQFMILSRGELPTSKGVILKIWFAVLEEYDVFKETMYKFEGHPLLAYIFMKRALHAKENSFLT